MHKDSTIDSTMDEGQFQRRELLRGGAAAILSAGPVNRASAVAFQPTPPKSVAAVVSTYFKGSHADVLVGKILEGWKQDGGPGPALKLVSLFIEQVSGTDIGREIAKKHRVPLFDSIEKTLTVGGDSLPIDGVICIGEHGDYPTNAKGQVLYPRRRYFEAITDTLQKYGRVVPVFNDKHLGPEWEDAQWMFERAQAMKIPFMAGSSLVLTYRDPDLTLPMNCEIQAAVSVGYSHLDIYGFHALDSFQCMVERRKGAETGVRWVQCLQGESMWKSLDDGMISKAAFDAALARVCDRPDRIRQSPDAALFLFQYLDGLLGAVFMLPGIATGNSIAIQLKNESQLRVTRFEERTEPRHPHFAYLLKGIERMIHTGRPSYPVERTLLSSGVLDRALTSRLNQSQRLMTPELAIRYLPADYPHAPLPELESPPPSF